MHLSNNRNIARCDFVILLCCFCLPCWCIYNTYKSYRSAACVYSIKRCHIRFLHATITSTARYIYTIFSVCMVCGVWCMRMSTIHTQHEYKARTYNNKYCHVYNVWMCVAAPCSSRYSTLLLLTNFQKVGHLFGDGFVSFGLAIPI